MDPVELLILGLRIVLVALLYLFLVMVMRTAARAVRYPAERPPTGSPAQPAAQVGAVSAAPDRKLRLVVVDPGSTELDPGELIEVADGQVLGRAQRADVVLADSGISGAHARVRRVARGWMLTDLGSTNGTLLNEAPVASEVLLAAGDVLTLGNVRLEVAAR